MWAYDNDVEWAVSQLLPWGVCLMARGLTKRRADGMARKLHAMDGGRYVVHTSASIVPSTR